MMLRLEAPPPEPAAAEDTALPYIDEHTAADQRVAEQLIAAEIAAGDGVFPPKPAQQTAFPLRFCSAGGLFEAEIPRLARNAPLPPLAPARAAPPEGSAAGDAAAWERAAAAAATHAEHQRVRAENLELLDVYGQSAWLAHTAAVEAVQARAQAACAAARSRLAALTARRQAEQAAARSELAALHEEWLGAVAKTAEVRRACEALESQLLQ